MRPLPQCLRDLIGFPGMALSIALASLVIGGTTPSSVVAQENTSPSDIDKPKSHFRIEHPTKLTDADAESIYRRILDRMIAEYQLSDNPSVRRYRTWRRYNSAPYLSAPHGNRYLNNYANTRARPYGQFERGGPLPPGAVIVKDSFTVTEKGDVYTGALSIMEKMQPGFNLDSGDWRFTMIMPDGSVLGTTSGDDSERVEFCASCHRKAHRDYLLFMPPQYRVQSSDTQ